MEASEESGRGVVAEGGTFDEQDAIKEHDNHGSVTPSSAPPASSQSGDPLDAATKAGLGLGGTVPAQGGATPSQD